MKIYVVVKYRAYETQHEFSNLCGDYIAAFSTEEKAMRYIRRAFRTEFWKYEILPTTVDEFGEVE